jgi:hypothetical protein
VGRTTEVVTAACALVLATKASRTADVIFIVTRTRVQEVCSFRFVEEWVRTDTREYALELNWRMTANEEFMCGEIYICNCALRSRGIGN